MLACFHSFCYECVDILLCHLSRTLYLHPFWHLEQFSVAYSIEGHRHGVLRRFYRAEKAAGSSVGLLFLSAARIVVPPSASAIGAAAWQERHGDAVVEYLLEVLAVVGKFPQAARIVKDVFAHVVKLVAAEEDAIMEAFLKDQAHLGMLGVSACAIHLYRHCLVASQDYLLECLIDCHLEFVHYISEWLLFRQPLFDMDDEVHMIGHDDETKYAALGIVGRYRADAGLHGCAECVKSNIRLAVYGIEFAEEVWVALPRDD